MSVFIMETPGYKIHDREGHLPDVLPENGSCPEGGTWAKIKYN